MDKAIDMKNWEPVIGLEIHLQLNTKSKLFSSAPNNFGNEPNTNITPICTGQPGALPVLNKKAVEKAVLFGLAIGAKISPLSAFDRKSYFYPDSPRNFQITQYENPIIQGGQIVAHLDGKERIFPIERAHLEDDTGKIIHFSNFAGIDYNRAGCPLIEIVSAPCIHSAKEAIAYAEAIRAIAIYLDISDGNMEEGSLRIDANISCRPIGDTTLRPRVEIKNLNSFSFLELAINSEVSRQVHLYTQNPHTPYLDLIPPGTYRWNQDTKQTTLMRTKESADDYRYFPEPDLGPIIITKSYLDQLSQNLPELPNTRHKRYITLGLSDYSATILINDKALSDYFENALKICPHPRSLCNWITIEFLGRLRAQNKTLNIPPEHIAKLVNLIEENKITGKIAKDVADDMIASPHLDPEIIVRDNPDYQPVGDNATLEPIVDQVLKENEQSIIDFRAGKDRAFAHLVGQVMKLTKGKASPQVVGDLLRRKLGI